MPPSAPSQKIIEDYGQKLFSAPREASLSVTGWTRTLLDQMMADDAFRLAALRFVDVAPRLRDDGDFMAHLSAYFKDTSFLKHVVGTPIPGSGFLGKVIAPLARRNIRAMAHSFILGETPQKALKKLEKLHTQGVFFSLDLLGEAVISKTEADGFLKAYLEAIENVGKAVPAWTANKQPEKDAVGSIARGNVSVKLSALYEHVHPVSHDESVRHLVQKFRQILAAAKAHNVHIHLDMEHMHLLPITLDVFEQVAMEVEYRDYPHLGVVLQAYLKESEAIFDRLLAFAKKRKTPFAIRLVKGANWDFEQAHADMMDWPVPVFSNKGATDVQFEALTRRLFFAFPHIRPCIASHNVRSLAHALAAMGTYKLRPGDVEFQMLTGMGESFRSALVDMGHRVRLYAPVGDYIVGMSYLVRRLLENTANQSFLRQYGREGEDEKQLLQPPVAPDEKAERPASQGFRNRPLMDFSQATARNKATNALAGFDLRLPVKVVPVVDGAEVLPKGEAEHVCPWQTDLVTTRVGLADEKTMERAVSSAKEALPRWADLGAKKRAAILHKAADLCEKRWNDLFALQVYESGKDWESADADIAEGIDFLRYYADEMIALEGRFQPASRWGEANESRYEPRGVTAVIAPWNFPFAISVGMTAAALVAGNPVVYKPAEATTAIGDFMCQVLWDAGVPVEVLHFLPAPGSSVGAKLVAHKDISAIAFTGSREVGCHIYAAAAQVAEGQTHLKKCIIEMGGKNTLIIDSDADLDEAVPAVVHSAFGFQGQKCSACSRAIVVGTAYDDFIVRLKDMVEGLRVGVATDPAMDVNAVIDAAAKAKIRGYIKKGKDDGSLLVQARLPEQSGHFVPPTVFVDVAADSALITEEVFGPVLVVERAKTVDEAVQRAQAVDYALTGGLFSRNPDVVEKVKKVYKVGNLYINRGITGALVGRQPFGGGKMSGTGTKAGGADYLLHFLEPRVMTENTMRRGFAPEIV